MHSVAFLYVNSYNLVLNHSKLHLTNVWLPAACQIYEDCYFQSDEVWIECWTLICMN